MTRGYWLVAIALVVFTIALWPSDCRTETTVATVVAQEGPPQSKGRLVRLDGRGKFEPGSETWCLTRSGLTWPGHLTGYAVVLTVDLLLVIGLTIFVLRYRRKEPLSD